MLLPPDPPMTRRGPQEVDAEELSGSLLVEEATASSPLKVSRNPPRASQLPAPLGSRAPVPLPPKSLPIDELPTSPLALDSAAPTEASLPPVPPTPLPMVARDAISDSFGESSALPKLPRVGLSSLSPRIRPALGAAVQASRQAIERAVQWGRARRPAIDEALEARSRWFLPAVGATGLAIGVGIATWILSVTRSGGDSRAAVKPPESAPSGVRPSSEPAPRPTAAIAPRAPAVRPAACTVAGQPRVTAPKAMVPAGVEVRSLGTGIGIGFASGEHQATVARLDAETLAVTSNATGHSRGPVRRVTPVESGPGLSALIDADRPGDPLDGRRTVATLPPLQIGVAGKALEWAKLDGAPAGKLWDLEGEGDVDAVRVAVDDTAPNKTMGVVFRQGNAVNVGIATGPRAPNPASPIGRLTHYASSGPAVGAPAIALQDGVALVAWADRASADEPWRVRQVRFRVGDAPGEPATFAPPLGGPGEQTMSPAVVAAPGGRFLLVWTEGPQARHDVRALTLGEDGSPIGSPLVISTAGVNAGQAQAAVTASGRGVVAFLESKDNGEFEVAVTPISCRVDAR